MSPEYIYIKLVDNSSVHIGTTISLEKRYKAHADEYNNEVKPYLHIFECNKETGHNIEADIKKEFKKYLIEREIYNYSPILEKEYKSFLSKHKDIIKQLTEEEVIEINNKITGKNDKAKMVLKKIPKAYKRNVAKGETSYKNILHEAKRKAKYIQHDNTNSKIIDQDECYTRYEDIEKMIEEPQIAIQFKDKCVFCNCDDPLGTTELKDSKVVCDEKRCSAFALYFKRNFKKLGLKKLICLHYANTTDLFDTEETILGIIYNYDGTEILIKKEKGFDGSFMHPKSIKILNEDADIVCTNHPFSLTKEFYNILMKSKKKFLVISPITSILYKSMIYNLDKKLIKPIKEVHNFLKGKRKIPIRASAVWMTNLNYKRKQYDTKKLVPMKDIPEKNIKIDDSNILLVNNGYIPSDYDKEFSISVSPVINGILELGFKAIKTYAPYYKGKVKFLRLVIKKTK